MFGINGAQPRSGCMSALAHLGHALLDVAFLLFLKDGIEYFQSGAGSWIFLLGSVNFIFPRFLKKISRMSFRKMIEFLKGLLLLYCLFQFLWVPVNKFIAMTLARLPECYGTTKQWIPFAGALTAILYCMVSILFVSPFWKIPSDDEAKIIIKRSGTPASPDRKRKVRLTVTPAHMKYRSRSRKAERRSPTPTRHRGRSPSAPYRARTPSAPYREGTPSAPYRAGTPSAPYRAGTPSAPYRAGTPAPRTPAYKMSDHRPEVKKRMKRATSVPKSIKVSLKRNLFSDIYDSKYTRQGTVYGYSPRNSK